MRPVNMGIDGITLRFCEARPAGTRIKLVIRLEQHRAAIAASISAGLMVVPVLARERSLCGT